MELNILGTLYTVKECSPEEDTYLENCDGYCDNTSKTICITKKKPEHDDDDFEVYRKKLLRHEIIHAFLNESGLRENFEHPNRFGHEETTIDWFAIQFPKILAVFKEADCVEEIHLTDIVEVVRCGKCKHGDVATISRSKDGEEDVACYCNLKNRVTDVDSYCPRGEKRTEGKHNGF